MRTHRGTTSVLVAAAAATGLLVGACTSGGSAPGLGGIDAGVRAGVGALVRFDGCDAFEAEVKELAAESVGPYGLGYGGERFMAVGQAVEDSAALPATGGAERSMAEAPTTTMVDTQSGAGDGGWTGTNVQEADVDEPDLVKVRGDLVVTLVGGTLRTVRIVDGQPSVVGSLEVGEHGGEQLLADGDTVLVLSGGGYYGGPAFAVIGPYPPGTTTVRKVDVSDPTAPSVVGQVDLDGSLVDARMVDGVARIVTTSGTPDLPLVQPAGGGARAEAAAEELNRQAIEETEAQDWLPGYTTLDDEGETLDEGPLVDCDAVHTVVEPAESTVAPAPGPQSLGMVNVVTVDLRAGGLAPVGAVSIMGSGHTVYGSAEALYVATTGWTDDAAVPEVTDVHRFAAADRTGVAYTGSGRVQGRLLNQFSLSEHEGHLRVATTRSGGFVGDIGIEPMPLPAPDIALEERPAATAPAGTARPPETTVPGPDTTVTTAPTSTSTPTTAPETTTTSTTEAPTTTVSPSTTVVGPPAGTSDSMVSVLRQGDGALEVVGSVAGLGLGEQIQAVRFLGDMGYVVTFRQIDPLYTLDLSEPTAPRVMGELKIPGFSSYLHPIGDGLLLGVGTDATLEGRVTGMQVSLYDVSDPATPREVQKVSLPQASSPAQFEHHAFLWWDPADLAVIPVQEFGAQGVFTGAIGYRVGAGGIGELGRIVHPETDIPMARVPCPPDARCITEEVPITLGGVEILRTVVVDDLVVTVSYAGVKTSALSSLADVGWVAFG